jgi:hypothetical protein
MEVDMSDGLSVILALLVLLLALDVKFLLPGAERRLREGWPKW